MSQQIFFHFSHTVWVGQWQFTYICTFNDTGVNYKLHIKIYACNLDCKENNIFNFITERKKDYITENLFVYLFSESSSSKQSDLGV